MSEDLKGSAAFKPALLVIDVQEDFCPPDGSLAVSEGRHIAPIINELLSFPFALKIATRDFHPKDHVSFDTSHEAPNNKAFQSTVSIQNPLDTTEIREIPLWPEHCVQGTKGANIISEINVSKIDDILDKGRDSRVEMFSAFADVFGRNSSVATSMDLANRLKDAHITHVFIVGLAGDYCVKYTALDARKAKFEVYVIEEAIRSADASSHGWGVARKELLATGIEVIHMNGSEIEKVRALR